MKKMKMTAILALAVLAIMPAITTSAYAASFVKVPVSVSYASTYWWRGTEFFGKGVGVLWTSAGVELGETGFAFSAAAGISRDYLTQTDDSTTDYECYNKTQKSLSEFDYGIAYAREIGILSLEAGIMYISYPFYDEAVSTAFNPSFWEVSLSLGLKTFLSPTLDLYYDYYIEAHAGSDSTNTPVNEDYYARLSVSHDILDADDFKFGIGAWVAYYNNAYLELTGWSDAGVSLNTSKKFGSATFRGAVSYARSIDKDFQFVYDGPVGVGNVGTLKNHLWAEFGVSYTF